MTDQPALRVMLLEDHGVVRRAMRTQLLECEPRAVVQEAASYEEALQLLEEAPPDIAFLDIDLKGERSGMDVLRHIRSENRSTRAIMLSARISDDIILEAIQNGASGYIRKDDERENVFKYAINAVFEGRVFLPNVIGKGGFSPLNSTTTIANPLEDIGIRGRAAECLYYLCQGLSNQVIAYNMGVEPATVANEYNTKIYKAFRVSGRSALMFEVSRRGIALPVPESARNKAA